MITPPTRPVIVAGMARSGTTVVGAMVRKCGDIVLFPELSPHSTPAMFDLFEQLRATLFSQRWRAFTPADVDARVVELLRRVWGAGRDVEDDDIGQARFGIKQPHAEEMHGVFASVLGAHRPQWVYSMRDPVAVYGSTLRMVAFGDITPDAWVERYERSLGIASELVAAGDMVVFDVSRAATDDVYRDTQAFAVKDFLGFDKPAGLRPFLKGWPVINAGGTNRSRLDEGEIVRRIQGLQAGRRYRRLFEAHTALSRQSAATS